MKTEQLIPLCRRYHAMLLHSDEQTISIAVVDTPPAELMEALRFATQKRIDIECWSQEQMDKRLQAQEKQAQLAQNAGRKISPNGSTRSSNRPCVSGRPIFISNPRKRTYASACGSMASSTPCRCWPRAGRTGYRATQGDGQSRYRRASFTAGWSVRAEPRRTTALLSHRHSALPLWRKIVLRLLHQVDQALDLEALGLSSSQLAAFRQALNQPQGLLLVTGPTGSGKTVTLYSALQARNREQVNICSVEDPLEIPIAGMNQTQINPRAGLTFHSVLRALLRQDPDIVMVGEIRDAETAEIALKAAQTGHLVLSTLHTNSTSETLTRLQQMGIARWMISSALSLVIAQRLVRKLCPHCRRNAGSAADLPHSLWPRPLPRWQAAGCEHCYHGYHGRLALFEVLPVTPGYARE
jgi:protein transport protein HofB